MVVQPSNHSLCCDFLDLDIDECRNERELSMYYKNLKYVEEEHKDPVIDFYKYNTWAKDKQD